MSAKTAIVLGSGIGSFVERLTVVEKIPFSQIGMPESSVPGHEGCFIRAELGFMELLVMQGRVHLYEGHSAHEVTKGIRWMAEQGIEQVILTNAAGTLNPYHSPGKWMIINDHLNLTGTSPLEGSANFVDLSSVYDSEWRNQLASLAKGRDMELYSGVYAGLKGPQYETPAEIKMLRHMGADAVGMSTVLEAIQAKALGLKVVGLSCLTNWASGMPGAKLDHADVVAMGKGAADSMVELLDEWCSVYG